MSSGGWEVVIMRIFFRRVNFFTKMRNRLGIFFFTTASRPVLEPTQPPIQWLRGALSLRVNRRGVKLTAHLHLVPRSRMRGAIPPLSQYVFMAWCSVKAQGQLYLSCFYASVHEVFWNELFVWMSRTREDVHTWRSTWGIGKGRNLRSECSRLEYQGDPQLIWLPHSPGHYQDSTSKQATSTSFEVLTSSPAQLKQRHQITWSKNKFVSVLN
jgi:hypothetical protein